MLLNLDEKMKTRVKNLCGTDMSGANNTMETIQKQKALNYNGF